MELEQNPHTKSPIDWIGDVFTILIMLPFVLMGTILVTAYYVVKFPLWWLSGRMLKRKGYNAKTINRDNK